MIKVHFDNGAFWQTEGARRAMLWTQASCRQRIARLMESLSTNDTEAQEQVKSFWLRAFEYIFRTEETYGDQSFEALEACNNFLILEDEFLRYVGEANNLVFISRH